MIILHQIFPHARIAKRVMMQDGHCHENHVANLGSGIDGGWEIPPLNLHWVSIGEIKD